MYGQLCVSTVECCVKGPPFIWLFAGRADEAQDSDAVRKVSYYGKHSLPDLEAASKIRHPWSKCLALGILSSMACTCGCWAWYAVRSSCPQRESKNATQVVLCWRLAGRLHSSVLCFSCRHLIALVPTLFMMSRMTWHDSYVLMHPFLDIKDHENWFAWHTLREIISETEVWFLRVQVRQNLLQKGGIL